MIPFANKRNKFTGEIIQIHPNLISLGIDHAKPSISTASEQQEEPILQNEDWSFSIVSLILIPDGKGKTMIVAKINS
jgi:hypothetical protein